MDGEYNVTKVLTSGKLNGLDLTKELFLMNFAKNYEKVICNRRIICNRAI